MTDETKTKRKKRKRKKNKAKEKEKRESSSPPTRVESYTTYTISDNHGRKGRRARQKFVNNTRKRKTKVGCCNSTKEPW
jgi:hypothetical protein